MYLHELGDEEASFTKEEMQVNIAKWPDLRDVLFHNFQKNGISCFYHWRILNI